MYIKYKLYERGITNLSNKLRPEIDEQLIKAIKCKFPNETALLGIAETVEWALRKLLK
jgi:hypothetical protein